MYSYDLEKEISVWTLLQINRVFKILRKLQKSVIK